MSTVMVVEDEPDLRLVVETLLGIQGFEVISFESAEDALPRLPAADAILLDVRLPGMSGLELVQLLDATVRSRVLFMSAHADMEASGVVEEHGCAGFLAKPFDFDVMCERLQQIVS